MKTAAPNHRKMARLARLLGIPRAYAVGIMECIWTHARQYAKDGDLSRMTPADWEDTMGVEDGEKVIRAVRESELVDDHPSGNGYIVHDWFDHCEGYIIRDLQLVGKLPLDWKRGSPLPKGFYNPRQSTTTHDKKRLRTAQHDKVVLARGKGEGEVKGKEREGLEGGVGETVEPATSPRPRVTCTESQAAAIYAMYPRKIKPIPAKKAIREAVQRIAESGNDDPLAFLQARVLAYAASESAKPPPAGETDWRPHPASWFNSGSYDNDDIEWTKPNGSGSSKNHRTQSSGGIRRNEVAAGHHPEPDRPVPTSL